MLSGHPSSSFLSNLSCSGEFRLASARRSKSDMDPDPSVDKIFSLVQRAASVDEVVQAMWPEDLPEGFSHEDEIFSTVQKALEDMVDST